MTIAPSQTTRLTVPDIAAARDSYIGPMLLALAVLAGGVYFQEGLRALAIAWQLPEYSHGPLIPLLSGFLFLRHLKTVPPAPVSAADRLPGVGLLVLSLLLGAIGKIARIDDIVAYALIGFIGGLVLVSFGWRRGKHFWPAVLHLVFMLPLPGTLYWKVSTTLQFISSEFGVFLIRSFGVPVYLDGNIIDLGVYKLHVAEACSGLRYLYPILSFSYIFAALYRGPVWHKAVLLLSAAPITVLMNSVRIGIIGVIVDNYGLEHVEGITHLLEGWVIFIASVMILFLMARIMLASQRTSMTLAEALDLDFDGIKPQLGRIRQVQPSAAMTAAAAVSVVAAVGWWATPERVVPQIQREDLVRFPAQLEDWRVVARQTLDPEIERVLGADDYVSHTYAADGAPATVEFFVAWYRDQTRGGIHSPEVCLPGGGWEMAEINRTRVAVDGHDAVPLNRAIIQKGESRLLVYYWFEQYGGQTASDYLAKASLLRDGVMYGRTDGALVRMITPILPRETPEEAETRLRSVLTPVLDNLPTFVPTRQDDGV